MKVRYANWEKLFNSKKQHGSQSPLRVVDLPGVQSLEDKLLIHEFPHRGLSPEIEEIVEKLSISLFGITQSQTEFNPGDWLDCDDEEYEREFLKHQQAFETLDLSDDDKVTVLIGLGLDFRDKRGNPLRCTRLLSGQAEAAAKGIKGKLPDRGSVDLNLWASNLEREATAFMKEQKTRGHI